MELCASSRSDRPPKSKSSSRSGSVIELVDPSTNRAPSPLGPKIFSRTSSAAVSSSTVVDCFRVDPFALFEDANNDVEESLEISEIEEPLGV